jgi:hypothetical protein
MCTENNYQPIATPDQAQSPDQTTFTFKQSVPTAHRLPLSPRTLIPSPSLLPRPFDKIPCPLLGCWGGLPDLQVSTSAGP